jgi:hypothetical protein
MYTHSEFRCSACNEVLPGPVSKCPHCGVRLMGIKTEFAKPHKPFENPGPTEAGAAIFAAFVLPLLSLPLAITVVRNAQVQKVRTMGRLAVSIHILISIGFLIWAAVWGGLDPVTAISVFLILGVPLAIMMLRRTKLFAGKSLLWIVIVLLILTIVVVTLGVLIVGAFR